MKIHDEIDDWSAGALCDALSPEERQNFERHLAACPRCRSLHEEDRKMNNTLKEAMVEARPDANFERRIIDGFREKTASGGFHPWRGLVWLMHFRIAQAAVALLIAVAMVKAGSILTGEDFPGGKRRDIGLFSARAGTTKGGVRATANGTLSLEDGTVDTTTVNLNAANPSLAALTFSGTNSIFTIAAGNGNRASGGSGDTNWLTSADWGDTPGTSGSASAGDTATFSDVAGQNSHTLLGANFTINSLSLNGGSLQNRTATGASPEVTRSLGATGITNGQIAASGDSTYAGVIRDGAFGIVKAGTGTVVLGGSNTYTGATMINGGVLAITATGTNVTISGGSGTGSTVAANNEKYKGVYHLARNAIPKDAVAANIPALQPNRAMPTDDEPDRDYSYTPDVYQAFSGSNSVVTTGSAATIKPTPIKGKKGTPAAKPKQAPNPANHPAAAQPAMPAATPPPVIDTRKLIRIASLEFEVASFEKSLNVIGGVALEEQGYIFSQNSAKGPNGKLQGTVVVKVLPQNLDRFLLKLRLLGDMKNQTVSAQDVTKDYTDTQAHIRNSEITEQRLIEMLKTRTGKVSDLLEVEDEIAKVRSEIEEMEGQIRVYDSQVQFATVTITLQEKDINQAAAYLLQEHAQLSLFAKDVEKAFADAKGDAEAAKAQTLESHIERDSAGRVVATLHLLIPPDASDEAIAKLKDIGRIEHFNSQTQRLARDGSADSDTAKMDRDKVELNLVIQQDAENPVQGTNISVQTDQVEEKTAEIKKAASDAGVEVKGAEFTRAHNGAEVSAMLLRMPMNKYAGFIERIKSLGKVKDFTVARREDSTATGDAPAEIVLQIFSQAAIVAPDTGLLATTRSTLGEGMSALMWSLKMIGVALAFLAPWLVIAGLVAWVAFRRHRNRAGRKQG